MKICVISGMGVLSFLILVILIPNFGFGKWEFSITVIYSAFIFLWWRSYFKTGIDSLRALKKMELKELEKLISDSKKKHKYLEYIYKDKYEYSERVKLQKELDKQISELEDTGFLKKQELKRKNELKLSEVRFCSACKVVKRVGTHHCRKCNKCTEELDHHCPLIGTCVGRENFPAFISYLILQAVVGYGTSFLILDDLINFAFTRRSQNGWIVLFVTLILVGFCIGAFYRFAFEYPGLWASNLTIFTSLTDLENDQEVPSASVIWDIFRFRDNKYTARVFKNFRWHVKESKYLIWPE